LINNNDASQLAEVIDRAQQAPGPDQQATELKQRAVVILTKLGQAVPAASPAESPAASPESTPAQQVDQTLVDEYKEWQRDYNQWLKVAAKTYMTVP
jgi:hypothetical protein